MKEHGILTLFQTTNFRLSETKKEFADNNFKCDENGEKFSKWLENTVETGEIACCLADNNFKCDENGEKFSKWVENAAGKGEIAHYDQFSFSKDLHYGHVKFRACLGKCYREKCWKTALSLFPTIFSALLKSGFIFFSRIYFVVCKYLNLYWFKFKLFDK